MYKSLFCGKIHPEILYYCGIKVMRLYMNIDYTKLWVMLAQQEMSKWKIG